MAKLNQENKELLKHYKELLDFGDQFLKPRYCVIVRGEFKKNYLKFTFNAVHNYNLSIYTLCKAGFANASMGLLRSILESYFNMNYALSSSTNKRLALYAIDDYKNLLKVVNGSLDLIRRIPSLKNKDILLNEKNLLNHKATISQRISDIVKGSKIKRTDSFPDQLIERVRGYDRSMSSIKKKGELERYYQGMYRHWSMYTHLTISSLQEFIDIDANGNYDPKPDKNPEISMVITTAYSIYLNHLKYMKKWGAIPNTTNLIKFSKKVKKI